MSLCQCSCGSVPCRCRGQGARAEDGCWRGWPGRAAGLWWCAGVAAALRPAGGAEGGTRAGRGFDRSGRRRYGLEKRRGKPSPALHCALDVRICLVALPGGAPALSLSSVQAGPPEHALQLHVEDEVLGGGAAVGSTESSPEARTKQEWTTADKPKLSPLLCLNKSAAGAGRANGTTEGAVAAAGGSKIARKYASRSKADRPGVCPLRNGRWIALRRASFYAGGRTTTDGGLVLCPLSSSLRRLHRDQGHNKRRARQRQCRTMLRT